VLLDMPAIGGVPRNRHRTCSDDRARARRDDPTMKVLSVAKHAAPLCVHASYGLQISTGTPLPTLQPTRVAASEAAHREGLAHRARRLTYLGLAWHALEAAVAIVAGVVAGSVALVGFGADSVIEAGAGLVVLWLVTGGRMNSHRSERHAQQLIAVSFLVLAIYITVEAGRDLIGGHHPATSWAGVGLSVITLIAMPPLAVAKRRVGTALGSVATASESRQTMLCASLSAALLVGLLANAIAGWWWADPAVALAIGAVALREAREASRGRTCNCC
jgi:divalent metal cation (Fe/Co/Zn/Cd) transporter